MREKDGDSSCGSSHFAAWNAHFLSFLLFVLLVFGRFFFRSFVANMSGSVYVDTTEPRRLNSLVDSTFQVDSRKFTLNIRPGAKNDEEAEASRKEDEKKEASAAAKEPSDRKETTDDPSSISNDRDRPEDAHGNGWEWERTEDGTGKKPESSIWTGFQDSLRHFVNYVRYVTTSLIRHCGCCKIDNKESAKKETECEHLETTPVVNGFDDIPDLVLLQIFKWIGTRDRLRLEAVNRKWKELLIESWKNVRVLDVWDIYSPSLTDHDIEFLGNRVTPFVKSLDFGTFHWERPEDKDAEDKLAIARKIFSSLSSPPCPLEEVLLWNGMLDQSTVSALRQIGHQITSIAVRIIPIQNIKPEPADGRNFFEPLPNLKRLECTFPGVYSLEDHVSCHWDTLPSSLEYLHLQCWGASLIEDDLLKKFLELEESLCSLRELHLTQSALEQSG